MLADDPDFFKKMDRSLHNDYVVVAGKGGKKKGGKMPMKKKKKMFKAKPAPKRPAPQELAKRAEQYANKKKPLAAAGAAA